MISSKRNDRIDYLKALAALFVVLHHAIIFTGLNRRSDFWDGIVTLVESVHVPMFFAIGGYLCHRQNIRQYLRKKAFRILLPFFTFSSLKLVYSIFISGRFRHASTVQAQLYDGFILGTLYWFPYAIFISYCVAMLFWSDRNIPAPAGKKRMALIAFVALAILNTIIDFPDISGLSRFQIGKTISHFCFFLAGMIAQQYEGSLSALSRWKKVGLTAVSFAAVAILLGLLNARQIKYTFPVKFVLAFALMYLCLMLVSKLPQGISPLKRVGRYSLQIMFMDSFFKILLYMTLKPILPGKPLLVIACTILNVCCSCLVCMVVERIPYLRRAFGL